MVNIKYKSDWRDKYLQHGSWGVKFLLWIVFTIVPFFIPGDFQWYGECCTLCLAVKGVQEMASFLRGQHHYL